MAEERLIDRDKDKKFVIRKNEETGEEEIIVLDEVVEQEREEEQEDLPIGFVDDEEFAELSEEEAAKQLKLKHEELERKNARVLELIEACKVARENENMEELTYNAGQIIELDEFCGEGYYFQIVAKTNNLTTLADFEVEDYKKLKRYATDEEFAEVANALRPLYEEEFAEVDKKQEALFDENEAKKKERGEIFMRDFKKALVPFAISTALCLVFMVLTIVFATQMFATEESVLVVVDIVMAVLFVVTLVLSIIFSRNFTKTLRRVRLNNDDTKTKLGREYLEVTNRCYELKSLIEVLKIEK